MTENETKAKSESTVFDISDFDMSKSDEGEVLELENPQTGAPMGIKITLLGTDSKAYQKQVRKNNDRRLRKRKMKLTAAELETENIELLAVITKGWDGMVENKQPVEFTVQNVRRIYRDYLWIKEQVDEFCGDRGNFLGE